MQHTGLLSGPAQPTQTARAPAGTPTGPAGMREAMMGSASHSTLRAASPQAGMEEQPNVTPEEQAAYERFIDNGFKIIYDQKVLPGLMDRLVATGNPVEGLASVTVQVAERLENAANRQNRAIDPDILFQGSFDLMADIADFARKKGVHDYSEEEVENAVFAFMDMVATQAQERGELDEQGIAEDFNLLMQHDRDGRLDELIPGISGYAETIRRRHPPPGAAGPQAGGVVR